MIYENGNATFGASSDSEAISFLGDYTAPPTITASVCGTSLDLNVTIQDITITGCTIMLSDIPGIETTISYIVFGE